MNKEIAPIKKRLKTQLEHKKRWNYNLKFAYDDEKEKYTKEINKADMIIEALQKEFILAVGNYSKLMNAEAVKQQWDMIVKEIESGL
jgi:hypothetical protein